MIENLPQIEHFAEPEANWQVLLAKCKSFKNFSKSDEDIIKAAYVECVVAHRDRRRKTGEPYYTHPLLVSLYFLHIYKFFDLSTIVACLLHDTVEDSENRGDTVNNIKQKFGEEIYFLVDSLTNIRGTPTDEALSFGKLLVSMVRDYRVVLVKLCDRLHNMLTLDGLSPEKQKKIAEETLKFFVPVAQWLGIWNLKQALEESAFSYLYRKSYHEIIRELKQLHKNFPMEFEPIDNMINEALRHYKIKYTLTFTHKTSYQIYELMMRHSKSVSEIDNYYSIVISLQTNEIPSCYYALGALYQYFKPQELVDYIAFPKFNQFASLLTYVYGPGGKKVEILLRTKEMDDIASDGVLKHLMKNQKYQILELEENEIEALEQWIESQIADLGDYQATMKIWNLMEINFFREEINVFLEGNPYRLPKNASVLDLAFVSNKESGLNFSEATVNGRQVQYFHRLRNKDEVTIKYAHSPVAVPEWLNSIVMFRGIIALSKHLSRI